MALGLLVLGIYLWLLAKWGKRLKARNAALSQRRLYGTLAGSIWFVASFLYLYSAGALGSGIAAFIISFAWNLMIAVLFFVTVAYAPKWIVGAPKPAKN